MTARAASAVANAPAAFRSSPLSLQRTCACGNHTSAGECDTCAGEKTPLRRRSAGGTSPARVPSIVNDVLRSPGRPLDGETRGFMEPLFGRDFSHVRIHTEARASRSALAVNADAYTVGNDVVFAEGKFAPGSRTGRHLLAHELTHTLQQRGAAASPDALSIGHPLDAGEGEADRVADAILEGAAAHPKLTAAPVLQRQEARSGTAADAETAADAGPGPYDGCGEYRQPVEAARAEATRLAGRAVTLLDQQHVSQAAPLLTRHFHLDPGQPESQGSLQLVRDQFARMQQALNSGIRIFCRSAPAVGLRRMGPAMPVSGSCSTSRAFSTSCAAGDPTSTVAICEMTLLEGSEGLSKTLLHEFAHIACNGTPRVRSGGTEGGEVYYPGDRLPGDTANDLVNADSYAWFALQADGVLGSEEPSAGESGSSPDHTGFGVLTALGGAATVAGAIGLGYGIHSGSDAGIGLGIAGLALGGLGIGLGIAGVAGAFDRRRPQQQAATPTGDENGAPRSLSELAALSAWQLAQLPESALAGTTGAPEGSGPRLEDYVRAWRMVRCIRDFNELTVDPLTPDQRGRTPTDTEWPVLRQILTQILAHENVGEIVRSPEGRGDLGSPPIADNVRVANRVDWGIKRYQLERLVSSIGAGVDPKVREWWAEARCGIRAGSAPQIVDQERQMAAFHEAASGASAGIGGFFFPPDDTVYVNEALMATLMGTRGDAAERADAPVIVGHEMGHLVGGRDRTREAFVRHFGGDTWICYWSAFEEGMAEITARDALMSGGPATGRGYEQYVQLMREIMETLGADRVRRAHLTGTPGPEIFEELRRGLPEHMDPGLPPVCREPGALRR